MGILVLVGPLKESDAHRLLYHRTKPRPDGSTEVILVVTGDPHAVTGLDRLVYDLPDCASVCDCRQARS